MEIKIINYDSLELGIGVIEEDLNGYQFEEKELIIKEVMKRLYAQKSKVKAKDTMDTLLSGVTLKGITKRLESEEEE